MVRLLATLRDRDLTDVMVEERGKVYREALDHLSERQWVHAVNTAVRTLDWFPTIHELLTLAESAPPLTAVPMTVLDRIDPEAKERYLETVGVPSESRALTKAEAVELMRGIGPVPVGTIE